jgi:hypothetical protein
LKLTEKQVLSLGHAVGAVLWDNMPFWALMGLMQHPDNEAGEAEHGL